MVKNLNAMGFKLIRGWMAHRPNSASPPPPSANAALNYGKKKKVLIALCTKVFMSHSLWLLSFSGCSRANSQRWQMVNCERGWCKKIRIRALSGRSRRSVVCSRRVVIVAGKADARKLPFYGWSWRKNAKSRTDRNFSEFTNEACQFLRSLILI
jgi:hypothetical protein